MRTVQLLFKNYCFFYRYRFQIVFNFVLCAEYVPHPASQSFELDGVYSLNGYFIKCD